MIKLDCFGDICPVPILKIEKQLKKIESGDTFMTVTDHSCVSESIVQTFKNRNVKIESEEVMNGVWEIYITKL